MKTSRKISPRATISFIATFTVCLCLIVAIMYGRSDAEKYKIDNLLTEKSTRINETISRLIYKTQVLSALVVQTEGQIDNFEHVASIIFDDPAIRTFAIAPAGVISQVYPVEDNAAAVGHNLLDPELPGNKEAIMAKETGQFVFGGPFEYVQGGSGLAGRMPVYMDSPGGGRDFWGIVSITLKYPDALEGVGLGAIERQGYDYEIWRINPDDGQKQVIAKSGGRSRDESSGFIEKRVSIQNADWYFRIMPVREWYQYPITWLLICAAVILSLLISLAANYSARLSYENREVRQRLERIIQTAPVAYMLTLDNKIMEINEVMKSYIGLDSGAAAPPLYSEEGTRNHMIGHCGCQEPVRDRIVRYDTAAGGKHRALLNGAAVEYEGRRAFVTWMADIEFNELKTDQIKLSQRNLQSLLDMLPLPVRVVDMESRIVTYANKSCIKLFECDSYDQICGRHIGELMPKFQSDGTPSSHKVDYMLDRKGPIIMSTEYRTAKGRIIDSILTSFKMEFNGRPSSVGVIKDLRTEKSEAELRDAAQAAEASSRAKSAFIANMSHEIRTPMNSIIGFSELALDDEIPPKTRDYLEKIKMSSDLLLQIINDILDISKIESGKMELERLPFNMHDVFRVCHAVIAPKAANKGVSLYCYAEPSVGRKLLGDPTKLRQVLLNLLSNAVKFTDVGTVKLSAAIEKNDPDSVTMRFEVKDSGIGVSDEQMERIFEPFVQADESTTRRYGGTGLGLPISREMIELMGGELIAESVVGMGTKFSFTLTFPTVGESSVPKIGSESCPIKKPFFRGEVLLCEDNEMNRQVVREHLSRVGLTTVTAANGREGVEKVCRRMENGEKPFDLIFMDIHMPVMDGLEASEALAGLGCTTPVIALTANVMPGDRKTYQAYGMLDHVPKPFKAHELWACLLRHLKPISLEAVSPGAAGDANEAYRGQMLRNFVKDNRTAARDIASAVKAGDTVRAHRLAHTLKNMAGLIGRNELAEAARKLERCLEKGGAEYAPELADKLADELRPIVEKALDDISNLLSGEEADSIPEPNIDREKTAELFGRLEVLLQAFDTDCLNLTDKLKAVPDTGPLIEQMERYDFGAASETLSDLRCALEV